MRTSLVLLALACGLAVCAAQLLNAAVTSTASAVSTATTATVTFTSTKGQIAGATNAVNLPCFSQACTCSAVGSTLSQVVATPQVVYSTPSASCPATGAAGSPSGTAGTSNFVVSNTNGPALLAAVPTFTVTASTTAPAAASSAVIDTAGTGFAPVTLGGNTVTVSAQTPPNAADLPSGAVTANPLVFNFKTTLDVASGGKVIVNLPYNYLANQILTTATTGFVTTCSVTNTAANANACPPVTASGTITCTAASAGITAGTIALTFDRGWIAGDPTISVSGGYTVQTMTAANSMIEGPAGTGATLTAFTKGALAVPPTMTINVADANAQQTVSANPMSLVFKTVNSVPVGGAFVLTTPVGYFRALAFTSTSSGAAGTATCVLSNPTTTNDVWTCTTSGANAAMAAATTVTWTSAAGSFSVLNNQVAGVFSVGTQTAQGFVIDTAIASAAGGAPAIVSAPGTMAVGAITFSQTTDNNPGLTTTTGTLSISGITSGITLSNAKNPVLVFTFPYKYIQAASAAYTTTGGAGATGVCTTTDNAPVATCPSTVTAGSTIMTCTVATQDIAANTPHVLILTAGSNWRFASNQPTGSFTLQAMSATAGSKAGIITVVSAASSLDARGGQATVAAATNSVAADKLPGVTTTGNLVLGVTPASLLSTGSTIVFTLPANYLTKTDATTFSGATISTSSGTVTCTMYQASAATACVAAGTTSTIRCVTGGAPIPSGAVASVTLPPGTWSLAKGATGTYTATTYNSLGLLVDKTSAGVALITASATGAVSNVQAAVFSKSTDQVPGLATTTGTLTFTFTTATTIPSGSISIQIQSQYLSTAGAFTSTMGSPSAAGPSGTCTISNTAASCAVGASVANCGVSSPAVAASQTLLCSFTSSLTAGVVTLILTAGTYTVGSSQPASQYTVSTRSTSAAIDTASTTFGTLPALAAGAVSAVATAAFSVAGDMVPGTTSTGTLTFGFTTATDLISGALIQVALPVGYLYSIVLANKLGTATINCALSAGTQTQGCAPTATTFQLMTCTTSAAVPKGPQSLVLQAGFVVGPKNAAAGTSYRVQTATAAGVVIDTAGSGSVPAITAGGSASGSGTAAASVAADLVPGASTTGTLTLSFTTQTKVPMTGGKIVFSLTQGWLKTAAAATLTGGSPATTSTCTMLFTPGLAASGCTAAVADTYTCTVGTADLAAGTYNLVLTAASGWAVGPNQPAGTFSVSTSNNGVTLDAASTTTGVLPKIGSTVTVTSFAIVTAGDSAKIGVASTGGFSIGFTTSTPLPQNAFILFTLPASNYFSSIGSGAQSMTGQSTTAPTCTWSTPVLTCKVNAALPAGASIISIAAGWIPGATVNSAQFPTITNFNKATYTISNLISPAMYLPAATYLAATNNFQAYFTTNECSAALAFPQFGTAPSSPGPTTPGSSSGKALALSAFLALSSIMLFLF